MLANAAMLQLNTKQSTLQEDSNGIRDHSDSGDVLLAPVLKERLVYPKATNSLTRAR